MHLFQIHLIYKLWHTLKGGWKLLGCFNRDMMIIFKGLEQSLRDTIWQKQIYKTHKTQWHTSRERKGETETQRVREWGEREWGREREWERGRGEREMCWYLTLWFVFLFPPLSDLFFWLHFQTNIKINVEKIQHSMSFLYFIEDQNQNQRYLKVIKHW